MRERERRQRAARGRERKITRTEVEGRERLARRVERPVVTREPPPGATRPRREEPSTEKGARARRGARPPRTGAVSPRAHAGPHTSSPEREPSGSDEGEEGDAAGERPSRPTASRAGSRLAPRRSGRRPS